jgi:FkbM family methyltransferase
VLCARAASHTLGDGLRGHGLGCCLSTITCARRRPISLPCRATSNSLGETNVIKQMIRNAVNSLGYEVTRRQPQPSTAYDVQRMMMGTGRDLIIFDVGAHAGWSSLTYRRLFPKATIHAFEPTPGAVDNLRAMFADDEHHQLHAVALSDRQGVMDFNLNASGATNSLLSADAEASADWRPLMETKQRIVVAAQTIDAFCAEKDITHIDLMKIDVQGAENRVLRGACNMLARSAIRSLFLEIIVAPTYVSQSRPDEIFRLLCEAGLSLVDFYDIWKRGPLLLQFDALFALPEYVKRLAERP